MVCELQVISLFLYMVQEIVLISDVDIQFFREAHRARSHDQLCHHVEFSASGGVHEKKHFKVNGSNDFIHGPQRIVR